VISPGLLQKVYGARDGRTVRVGVAANALALIGFAFVPPLLGMIARVHHPGLVGPATEQALPLLLMHDLPAWVGSLGLAALFSAEVSTCDAILFMLSTSLSQDLYRRFVHPAADDRRVLAVARAGALGGAAFSTLIAAFVVPTIIQALEVFYTLLSVSLFVPVVAGLYSRRGGVPEALAAIGAGVSCVVAVQLAAGGAGIGGWTPAMLGLVAAAAAFAVTAVSRGRS
jgi:SSS family solute:Na+ symporter